MENCDNLLDSLALKTKSIIVIFLIKTKCLPHPQPLPWAEIQVPSNDPYLKTKICIFIVTRKDGTPLDVTSVSEEDVVEICVTLGHTYPLGVLWYLADGIKWHLFHTTRGDVMSITCWCHKGNRTVQDELTAVQTVALLEHHIRVYIAVVGGDPSKP